MTYAVFFKIKDVRRWQFLTIEAAKTLYMVCLPPEEHIFRKELLGNRPFKKSHFVTLGLTMKFVFLWIFSQKSSLSSTIDLAKKIII